MRILQESVIRRIEIIGEAVKNMPDDFKETYPKIPWKQIVDMRDILIHQYFGIELNLTWEVIERDLPNLKNQIRRIKKELG